MYNYRGDEVYYRNMTLLALSSRKGLVVTENYWHRISISHEGKTNDLAHIQKTLFHEVKAYMQPIEPIKVFISYAHSDQKLRKKLEEHLSSLTRSNTISIWQDQVIPAGRDRDKDTERHLKEADVILLLISSSFMASCWDNEVQKALERHKAGTVQVIPIILRPIDWRDTSLGQLQALPTNGKPITQWDDQDAAFEDVVRGIRVVVMQLQITRRTAFEQKQDMYEGSKWQNPAPHPSAGARYTIGVDIDRSHLALLLTDLKGTVINEELLTSFSMGPDARACLTQVAEELQALVAKSHVAWEQVVGIGLATPGPLDPDSRRVLSISQRILSASQRVLSASQMFGWDGLDIPNYMEQKLKRKIPIYLNNDANMGALGESRFGAGRGVANLVYVKIGIGIGAGLIINGHLHRGNTNAAGELGHIVVEEQGEICTCGNRGCLETVAAELAIVKDACEGTSLRIFYPHSTQTPALAGREGKANIAEVIEAAHHNDAASQAALQRAGERVGRALVTIINLLNPSMILLDGDVIKHDAFLETVQHSAQVSSLHATWSGLNIEHRLLEKSVAYGAVARVIDSISSSSS